MNWISNRPTMAWRTLAFMASWRFILFFPGPVVAADAKPDTPAITGRIVVEGEVPPAKLSGPGKDECCQLAKPIDQSVLVGPNDGLANVVVTVETRRGEPKLDSRWFAPSDLEGNPAEYVLTNKGCAFEPRVLIARTMHKLVLANADPTMHNVNIDFVRNPGVNVVVEPDGRREILLKKAEPKPIAVRCNVHSFMNGWILVRDNIVSAAISGEDGRFQLALLPKGDRRLRFWHEGKPLVDLPVAEGRTDKRGEVVVTVPESGRLDLGEIVIAAESLRP